MGQSISRGSGSRANSASKKARGPVARASRGGSVPHNKDALGSDRSDMMSAKPAARRDSFGSTHNQDDQKKAQVKMGRESGFANTSFRESGQDERALTGRRNRRAGAEPAKSKHPAGRGSRTPGTPATSAVKTTRRRGT